MAMAMAIDTVCVNGCSSMITRSEDDDTHRQAAAAAITWAKMAVNHGDVWTTTG